MLSQTYRHIPQIRTLTVQINLMSPGGAVAEYGLAASHLLRLKRAGVRTVVAVDKMVREPVTWTRIHYRLHARTL